MPDHQGKTSAEDWRCLGCGNIEPAPSTHCGKCGRRSIEDILVSLAERRKARMRPNGRPKFDLTEDEIQSSTRAAMRLADAVPDASL